MRQPETEYQTKYDVANIEFVTLLDAARATFGGILAEAELHHLILAEAVRQLVREDASPPGVQHQARIFDLSDILKAWSFTSSPKRLRDMLYLLESRKEIIGKIPELDIQAPHNCFFLTEVGIAEGLRQIRSYREAHASLFSESKIDAATRVYIDTTNWTGLGKKISAAQSASIRQKSKDLLSAIVQSDADPQTKADACRRVEAVLMLLEAPNKPWREIVELLSHPTVSAFFAAVSIIQLIVGATR